MKEYEVWESCEAGESIIDHVSADSLHEAANKMIEKFRSATIPGPKCAIDPPSTNTNYLGDSYFVRDWNTGERLTFWWAHLHPIGRVPIQLVFVVMWSVGEYDDHMTGIESIHRTEGSALIAKEKLDKNPEKNECLGNYSYSVEGPFELL